MTPTLTPADKPFVDKHHGLQKSPGTNPRDHGILDRSPWPANNRCEKRLNAQPSKERAERNRQE